MAEKTAIEWCDHSFNGWWGCQEISPGCKNCYAAAFSKRVGRDFAVRTRTSEANWKLPLRWNERAFFECSKCHWRGEMKLGREYAKPGKLAYFNDTELGCGGDMHETRRRVFCSSMADVFDNEVDPDWRAGLWALIRATPNLDWQLLTKRIGNAAKMLPPDWFSHREDDDGIRTRCELNGYPNVWLGSTIVNQEEADRDIPKLLAVPARVRFLSIEPMLGPVDLSEWLHIEAVQPKGNPWRQQSKWGDGASGLGWVIVGGESGTKARDFDIGWARSLVDQCKAAGVPVLVKQLGAKPVWSDDDEDSEPPHWGRIKLADKKGGDLSEWPADLRVRQFPSNERTTR